MALSLKQYLVGAGSHASL